MPSPPGLPDGTNIFAPKHPFWVYLGYILMCLELEIVGTFYGHVVFCCGNLVYIFPFWYVAPIKIWQPWSVPTSEKLS
jgi:hypothetical protein